MVWNEEEKSQPCWVSKGQRRNQGTLGGKGSSEENVRITGAEKALWGQEQSKGLIAFSNPCSRSTRLPSLCSGMHISSGLLSRLLLTSWPIVHGERSAWVGSQPCAQHAASSTARRAPGPRGRPPALVCRPWAPSERFLPGTLRRWGAELAKRRCRAENSYSKQF